MRGIKLIKRREFFPSENETAATRGGLWRNELETAERGNARGQSCVHKKQENNEWTIRPRSQNSHWGENAVMPMVGKMYLKEEDVPPPYFGPLQPGWKKVFQNHVPWPYGTLHRGTNREISGRKGALNGKQWMPFTETGNYFFHIWEHQYVANVIVNKKRKVLSAFFYELFSGKVANSFSSIS